MSTGRDLLSGRLALGVSYRGTAYSGWQSQPGGRTVQDHLERALSALADAPVRTICAGRTDAGVHALNQVVHFDAPNPRRAFSWVRGSNRHLPADIAVQWCLAVPPEFHARNHARARGYAYIVLESAVRPGLDAGRVGWVFRPLDQDAMRQAAAHLLGEHDFSAFRSAECQAKTPVKRLDRIEIARCRSDGQGPGAYWRFEFHGVAFLHHMVRNIMACLVAVGAGLQPPSWVRDVLQARDRDAAAPTFAPDGLYFLGPRYDDALALPRWTPAFDSLPRP